MGISTPPSVRTFMARCRRTSWERSARRARIRTAMLRLCRPASGAQTRLRNRTFNRWSGLNRLLMACTRGCQAPSIRLERRTPAAGRRPGSGRLRPGAALRKFLAGVASRIVAGVRARTGVGAGQLPVLLPGRRRSGSHERSRVVGRGCPHPGYRLGAGNLYRPGHKEFRGVAFDGRPDLVIADSDLRGRLCAGGVQRILEFRLANARRPAAADRFAAAWRSSSTPLVNCRRMRIPVHSRIPIGTRRNPGS